MISVSFPASLFDFAELGKARTALHWAILREMRDGGRSWAARDENGLLIGLFGLYPLGDGVAEAWFNVRPEAGRHMRAILSHARLTLPAQHYFEIVTICVSRDGERIAQALGFEFFETSELGDVWKWTH